MGGRGKPPSGTRSRERDNVDRIQIVSDGKMRGPVLPVNALQHADGTKEPWHPMTKKWWNEWRKSPQAVRMLTGPDWSYMLDTALLHHEIWTNRSLERMSEVRLRVAKFGATPEDRARLGVEIAVSMPSSEKSELAIGNVTSMDDRRQRIAAEG